MELEEILKRCEHCGSKVATTIETTVCGDSLELCPECFRKHQASPVMVNPVIHTIIPKDDKPKHYQGFKYDALDVAIEWKLDFTEGNVLKYLFRYKRKNGLEDLEKLLVYANRLKQEHLKGSRG